MSSHYIGNELELFQKAHNWKNYYGRRIQPFLKGEVLEVGAGIGATTKALCDGSQKKWVCLEPDGRLSQKIEEELAAGTLPSCVSVRTGLLSDQPNEERYDAIIYIDVIEHIENDRGELSEASQRLRAGGHLIILVPAFNFLYSPFDKAIGHYRRYNKKMLLSVIPADLKQIRLEYLDVTGFFASVVNKLFLRQSYPTAKQISMWDSLMIPVSKLADPVLFHAAGKSLLGIWQKN
jgi:SAM-dependent methyltransferase